ncbi:MAG: ATP-binding cassette domain-containing protein, partial [Lachnospiraceae bacterium]|nr:ATP-binding cassette domain-containing protein [Lachnospiraceae bacterium]
EITLGTNVHIGYYDQEHHVLHMDKTLFDEISDEYPYLNQTEIRNTLAAFLFTGDDVYKQIGNLSGGERGRISLAKLMLSEANFLILDEPTNHLDITSKEILEDALNSYEGTVLYVSHDRYFINRTAGRILDLRDGKLTGYLGNYDYYLEKRQAQNEAQPSWSVSSQNKDTAPSDSKLDWQAKKEQQAKARKRENDLKKCEDTIALLEKEIDDIESDMALPENATNASKLQELSSRQEEINDRLLSLYEKWEELSS